MCASMADIQSATAEIRRGQKKEESTGQKYYVRICYAERPIGCLTLRYDIKMVYRTKQFYQ